MISAILGLLLAFPGFVTDQPIVQPQGALIVGDILPASYSSPNPYVGLGAGAPTLVYSEEIHLPGATYVAPYFSRFELAPGDYVIVRSPSGHRSWRYENFGKGELGRTEGFWGIHVTGERLVIELYSASGRSAWGYTVDAVARGFAPLTPEAVCGNDDKENAQCYAGSHPVIYNQSRAVARLLIQGAGLCTGWLVGSEGHLLTNNHCISTASAAMNTNYELMAEGTCPQNCAQLECDGTIVTTTATLVQTSAFLDYTLVQLSVNPTDTYGYFQLRASGPVAGERLYIPQHPGGRGKEIAVVSDNADDQSGFPEVDTVFNNGGRMMATYYGDTEGGSSGSPVVGHSDNCVVVVHAGAFGCSGLGNTGTVVDQVISDLGANVPADAVVSAGQCLGSIGSENIFADDFESGETTNWSSASP